MSKSKDDSNILVGGGGGGVTRQPLPRDLSGVASIWPDRRTRMARPPAGAASIWPARMRMASCTGLAR